jgi:hypothetical protein
MTNHPHRLRAIAEDIATCLAEDLLKSPYPGLETAEIAERTDICVLTVAETLDLMQRAGLLRAAAVEFYTRSVQQRVTLTRAGVRSLLPASEVEAALEAIGTKVGPKC